MALQPTKWQPPKSELDVDQPVAGGGNVFIPVSPELAGRREREEERKARADARAEEANARAAAAEARAAAKFAATGGAEGTAVPVGAANDAKANVSQYTALTRALNTFKDDFGGNPIGGAENTTEAYLGIGTPGQSEWWADFRTTDNLIRNTLFGASLTEGEKAAYNATTITPGMRPEKIRENLARRQEIIKGALQREREFFIANGYKPQAVDVLFRPVMQEGPTEEAAVNAPADQETAQPPAPTGTSPVANYRIVTPEESASIFGEARFDAQGNPIGSDYEGETFLADGTPGPFMGRVTADPREQMGLLESVGETITGSARETEETRALPDWTDMPELNSLSVDSFQAALGTMVTNPAESVAIIRSQFPGVQVRQDQNGNFILRSSADGKEYAIKPGFRMSDVPRAIGSIAAFTPAGRATTAGGAALAGGLTQAGVEASQAALGGQFNPEEVLAAAGGNVAGQQIERGINAIRGAMPARPAAPTARPRVIPDAAEVIATGEREGVDVMTSNVRPPRTWFGNWLRSTGEKLPIVGTGGAVAKQAEQRAAMIERLAEEYRQAPASIDEVTADFMKTRGGEIAKYTQMKRDVFSETAGAPPPVAKESLDALDMAIGRYGRQETFQPLTQKLQGWRNDLANAQNINDVEAIRKSIGDTFQDESMKAASTALRDVVDGPKGLYAALKTDMGDYIRAQAGDKGFRKWSVANGRLSDFAGDLEKTTLERILKTGDATPEEAKLLLFSNKPSDVRALFRNLSPQGKERARAGVVQKLIDDAGGAVALSDLSPAKFRGALEKSMERIGVAFPAQDVARFTGMLRLLQATQNAEKAAVTTPTGQASLPFLGAGAGAAMFADLFTGAAVGATSMAAFRGYESKAMRNLLVSLSKTKQGSKAESNLIATIGKVAARGAPAAAATGAMQTQPRTAQTSTIEVR